MEGILSRTISDLESDQPMRRVVDEAAAAQIDDFISRVKHVLALRTPAQLVRAKSRDPA